MANKRIIHPVAEESGSKGIDVPWFASDLIPDITPGVGTVFTLHFAFLESSVVEYKITGNYVAFEKNTAVTGGILKQITLREGDAFNIRAKSAVTLEFCRVDLL